jgi:hypothetical protein
MLYNRRRRQADLLRRESNGESFWTETFEGPLRVKFVHIMSRIENGFDDFTVSAQQQVLFDEGKFFLSDRNYEPAYDYQQYLLNGPDGNIPMLIEAWSVAAHDQRLMSRTGQWSAGEMFDLLVNQLLREHRVSFELSSSVMVPFSSLEMHVEVVQPALGLLASTKGWESVESAYQSALSELSKGDAADAVTDAGTALQEAFTALGCSGDALGPLIKSARQIGVLSSHDAPMLDALDRITKWVSADRSVTGDTHNADPARVEDAWLVVHVVGALLVRFNRQTPRP